MHYITLCTWYNYRIEQSMLAYAKTKSQHVHKPLALLAVVYIEACARSHQVS